MPTFPFQDPALSVETRVADLVGRMTLEEKAGQLGHAAPAIPRLGVPAYDWWSEALHGVARAGRATVFPQAIGLAATWDTDLVFRVASATSLEARAKHEESLRLGSRGIYEGLTFFSPNINIFRDPRWGRGMETYGEDPFLSGRLAVAFVRGMQGDDPTRLRTVATAKHYAVHSGPEPDRHSFDAVVSERDLRETYLSAFEAAVTEGGVGSVMCAYNRVHGDPACASRRLLQEILRDEWGFSGYVVSDCWAISDFVHGHEVAADETEAAAQALRAGTDLACGPEYGSLPEAVRRGLVTEAEMDAALARAYGARFRLGLFDPPGSGPWTGVSIDVVDSDPHRALALEAARKSMVLLKNERDLLPLRNVRTLAVIGPDADDVELLLGNYNGWPADPVTPLAGLRAAAAERGIRVLYARGSDVAPGVASVVPVPGTALEGLTARYFETHDLSGEPFAVRAEAAIDHQWWRAAPLPGMPADSFSVRWTGTLVPPVTGRYALGVRVNGGARVLLDDSVLVDFTDRHVVATPVSWMDLAAGEGRRLTVEYRDRRIDAQTSCAWAPPAPDLLAEAVGAAERADVAVLFLGLSPRLEGEEMPVEVPGFAGGDRVDIGLPEPQEELLRAVAATGTPVVLVLMSGSAVAVPWAAEGVEALVQAWYPGQAAGDALADVLLRGRSPGGRLPVTFYRSVDQLPPFADYAMEGRTYRWFRGEPLFPFGHGLSYARFRYRDLRAPGRMHAGDAVELSVEVENAGDIAADEVVQVYVTDLEASVPAPVRSLAGFTRVSLAPGERRRVSFTLRGEALSIVEEDGRRVVEPGAFEISVGGKQPGQRGAAGAAPTEVLTTRVEVVR
ncbi:MAG TPA: glycoside hydrolase family 3 C-terminal domain-containing protein [Longimicrobiales bacterium]|nr:glycoside hydrolase family 3 C-terminal domain-containing protein [Longimicrobiales bacterium]